MDHASVLETRVRLLERGHRRLVLVCIALAVCLAASVFSRAFWVPRELSAQRFLLIDAGGETRGEWAPSDVIAGEMDGKPQPYSETCLRMRGQKSSGGRSGGVRLCGPWDPLGGPSLSMSEQNGASLQANVDAYTVTILGRSGLATGAKQATLALGAGSNGASLAVSDKEGRITQLRPDGLLIQDSTRALAYKTPGTTGPAR